MRNTERLYDRVIEKMDIDLRYGRRGTAGADS